jgi:hypothetical protein
MVARPVCGKIGSDIQSIIFLKLRKENLWPVDIWSDYGFLGPSEDDIFDMIEFFYDYVSKPIDLQYHNYNDCGMHYSSFDQKVGRVEFSKEINTILKDYKDGFEITNDAAMTHQFLAPWSVSQRNCKLTLQGCHVWAHSQKVGRI